MRAASLASRAKEANEASFQSLRAW